MVVHDYVFRRGTEDCCHQLGGGGFSSVHVVKVLGSSAES